VSKDERKARRKADNALYRSLATQLLIIAMSGGDKPDRYLAAADACDQCAARLRERASEA
jgi:hypothetical protein